MKKLNIARLFLVCTSALLVVNLQAGPTHSIPFTGSSTNQAISAVPVGPEHVFVTTIGGGHATHLVNFTFATPPLTGLLDFSIEADKTCSAANGDELPATLVGNLDPFIDETGRLFLVGDVNATIEGGTGR